MLRHLDGVFLFDAVRLSVFTDRSVWTEHDQGYAESVSMPDLAALLPGFRFELEDDAEVLFTRKAA